MRRSTRWPRPGSRGHFTCYEIKPFRFTRVQNVSLVDQYGSSTVDVDRPNKLCAPANKNDEDPTAPTDPDHLTSFKITHTSVKRTNQVVVNQFGTIKLDVVKSDLLFVPTAKSLVAPAPPSPANPDIDHFQCYKVKRSRGTSKFVKITGVKVDDQFGTGTIDLIKPVHLCTPVNKNNEEPGAETHVDHLLCYKVKARAPFNTKHVWLGNQFGPFTDLLLTRRQEFCVPSLKNPPPTTTTTSTTTTTTTSTTTTSTTTTSTTTTTTSTTTTEPTTTSTTTTTTTTTEPTSTSTTTTTTTTTEPPATTTTMVSSQFQCPPADQLGFGLRQSDLSTDPIFCSYPAVEGEDPNDFFCTYSATTGALVEDHDAGLCEPNAVPNF